MMSHTDADLHEQDLAFMRELREASPRELVTLLRWQACEPWRRVAIEREMAGRA